MSDSIIEDDGGPLGETLAASLLEGLSVQDVLVALQVAMAREGGTRTQTLKGLPIGTGLYDVRFGIGEAEFIQERHDMGPHYALQVIQAGRWTPKLLGDVVEIALIGGGTSPTEAGRLRRQWVDKRPWAESVPVATVILNIGIVGVPDEPPGKQEGEATPNIPTSPEERYASPSSTDTPA